MVKIYNTLTKQKEEFKPIVPGKIGLYICGVTVYDHCHIGHAKTYISFDTIIRYLKFRGYDVNYIRNITDIDDKIINKAIETKTPWQDITNKYINAMHEDLFALGALSPNKEPKATEFMPQMIELIQKLEVKGYAYVGKNGDVYYDVSKKENYGCLAGRNLEELQSGARVDVNDAKKNPLDFVLWKMSKPGEPYWESPWGQGRPGWHLECSAMSMHYLGENFDIHGGGFDLIFPHHENECAQSEAANDKTFVNTWMHVGFLQINKEKMSKSLGNFFTIKDVLENYNPEILRYFLVSGHYRSQSDYSIEQLENAKNALERLYISIRDIEPSVNIPKDSEYEKRFIKAMDDDFNTPEALSILFDLAKSINVAKNANNQKDAEILAGILKYLSSIMGLLQQEPEKFLKGFNPYIGKFQAKKSKIDITDQEIENLIKQRNTARANKDWSLSDKIRDELMEKGVVLEDSATGTTWRRDLG